MGASRERAWLAISEHVAEEDGFTAACAVEHQRSRRVRSLAAVLVLLAVVLCATEGGAVQIFFEQSGGFAGMRFNSTVDTEKLPSEEAQKVLRLVEKADFFHLPEQIASPRPQPDRYRYSITVRGEGGSHTVHVSEEAVPACLAPLVRYLKEVMPQERASPR